VDGRRGSSRAVRSWLWLRALTVDEQRATLALREVGGLTTRPSPTTRTGTRKYSPSTPEPRVKAGPELPVAAQDVLSRPLIDVDPEIADVLRAKLDRERRTLEMIASENFVPRAVLECQDFAEVGRIIGEPLQPEFNEQRGRELAERAAAIADRHPLYSYLDAPLQGAPAAGVAVVGASR
jgi:hypothetical protein